jgi:FPC/CPF motif-containing protein YcgG
MMWRRLQSISDLDALEYAWDTRVSNDSGSPNFSYSIKSEALYVIGLHNGSNRRARHFRYPTLVFNPRSQFDQLRASKKYGPMREAVRKRDLKFSGSINPMLTDFGEASEAIQYSGKQYEKSWKCPFVSRHASNADYPVS